MVNVKIYKRLLLIFALALTVYKRLQFNISDLQKVGQGHGEQFFAMTEENRSNLMILAAI